MYRKYTAVLFVLLCGLVLAPSLAMAQTTGSIRGTVEDPDGSPLPGATVVVEGTSLLEGSRTRTTSANGMYNFPALPTGTYTVRVELSGFRSVVHEEIRVSLNKTTTVDFRMALSSVEETITVTGQSPVVDVKASKLSTNFGEDFMEDLPAARSYWDLIQQAPGMSNVWKDGTSDRTVAFGSNQQSNTWQVDGLNLTAPETGSSWLEVNPEAIAEIQVMGVGAPAEYGNASGGAFNIVTKRGSNEFHGSGSYYWQTDELTGANVTLADVGPRQSATFLRDYYREFNGTLGGPIVQDRVWFFASGRYSRDAAIEPRLDPNFIPVQKSDIYDLKISTRLSDDQFLDAVVHFDNWDYPYEISAFQDPDSFSGERGTTPGWNAQYRNIFSDQTFLEVKYGGWWADDIHDSQTGSLEPAFVDFTPVGGGPLTYTEGVWWPWTYVTWHQQASGDVSHYADDFIEGDHDFKFGVQYSYGVFDTQVSAGVNGYYFAHYYGYYYQVVQEPYRYGGVTQNLGAYVDDSWTVGDRLTLNLGVRYDWNDGRIPEFNRLESTGFPDWPDTSETKPGRDIVDWHTLAPRLGVAWIPTDSNRTVIRGSFGVYYDQNVGGNWDAPTTDPPPYTWFWLPNWPSTEGKVNVFELSGTDWGFDEDLQPPRTYQTSVGFETELIDNYSFGAQYIYKSTTDLIGWELVGGSFDLVPFTDPFTGDTYTLWSTVEQPQIRKGNEPGNVNGDDPDSYWQKYHGMVLTFEKRWTDLWSMQASYTLSKSWGLIPRMLSDSQFNPFYGSQEGTDPNNYINAEQRLQADRPHMFRLQGNFMLPWEIDLTALLNIQSGRPFNRQVHPGVLSQGTTEVIMTSAGETDEAFGRLRYPTMKRVDIGIGKRVHVGDVTFKIDGQIYNLTNEDAHNLHESAVLQAGDTFIPTDWVWPRRLQVRLGFEF